MCLPRHGTWGALATGIFASKAVNAAGADGLLHGNPALFYAQLTAVSVVWLFSFAATYIIAKLIDLTMGFTVSHEQQKAGLDVAHYWDDKLESETGHLVNV